jgi:ABC-type nitrate/sulfonate/bicarbonate transport system permease component
MSGRALSLGIWVGLLALWEAFARAGDAPDYLIAPSVIAASLAQLAASGDLWPHLVASLFRVAIGLLIGATAGTLIGLLAGVKRPVELYFDPLISLTYPVPKIAILPILIAWLGLGDASKIAIIVAAIFYPCFINSYYGAKGVSPNHLRAAWNMGASQGRVFWRVILPSALPQILAGLRIALALSFIILFAAEMIGARAGLGYLIIFAEENLRFDIMWASLVTIAILGFIADRSLLALRLRLLAGRPEA